MTEANWKSEVLKILMSKQGKRVLGALALIVAARVGVNWYLHRKPLDAVPQVQVTHPVIKNMDVSLNLPANVEAIEQASLYAHVGGYLKKLYVDEGDKVKKGQLLAQIEAPDIVQEFNRDKAAADLKEITRKRYEQLLKEKVVSQQEFDTVDAEANEAKAKFDNAAANLAYTRITAPFAGSIARRYKYPGDLITTATKGGETPIFVLVNEDKLRIAINVPQSEVAQIHIGHPVDIRVDALQGKIFHGEVSRLDALLDESTKTQRILIDIRNDSSDLHAGMFASVELHIQHKDNALTIPKDAVHETGGPYVFVVKDKKVRKTPVALGIAQGSEVEVTSGLTVNDSVVLHGSGTLADGMEVEVSDASGSSARKIAEKP